MKYLIAIIFVTLSFSQIFAQPQVQTEVKEKDGKAYLAEEARWQNIKKDLQLSEDKKNQLRSLENSYKNSMEEATGDKKKVMQSQMDIELYRLLSKEQLNKYDKISRKSKVKIKEN